LTIKGRNFAPRGLLVFTAWERLYDVTVVDTNTIRAVTRRYEPGRADVTVINPDGQRGVLKGGFRFERIGLE
jgi:hypothetical protein